MASPSGVLPSGKSVWQNSQLKTFMKSCGLEAWHIYIIKHTTLDTPQRLRMITADDLKKFATAANMKLDQKTIDQARKPQNCTCIDLLLGPSLSHIYADV